VVQGKAIVCQCPWNDASGSATGLYSGNVDAVGRANGHGKLVIMNGHHFVYSGSFELGEMTYPVHNLMINRTMISVTTHLNLLFVFLNDLFFHGYSRRGFGVLFRSDGSRLFEGKFEFGAPHGQGTHFMFDATSVRASGLFERGRLVEATVTS
jgi:hypothetical protein